MRVLAAIVMLGALVVGPGCATPAIYNGITGAMGCQQLEPPPKIAAVEAVSVTDRQGGVAKAYVRVRLDSGKRWDYALGTAPSRVPATLAPLPDSTHPCVVVRRDALGLAGDQKTNVLWFATPVLSAGADGALHPAPLDEETARRAAVVVVSANGEDPWRVTIHLPPSAGREVWAQGIPIKEPDLSCTLAAPGGTGTAESPLLRDGALAGLLVVALPVGVVLDVAVFGATLPIWGPIFVWAMYAEPPRSLCGV